ncbi:MAG: hypothetical protein JSR59_20510 [Proteobacteria bacterium]|nr:hypothetical protein [Pseudomonadota bacterium]
MDRTPSRLRNSGPASGDEADTLASLFSAPRQATVVFKRRRSVGTADGSAGEPSNAAASEAASVPRAPKVFRTLSALSSAAAPATSPSGTPAEPPKVSRRRRSDLRAPRLISHVIVEPSKPEPEQAGFSPRHRILVDLAGVSERAALYESVCGALDDVQSTLDVAHLARGFELP